MAGLTGDLDVTTWTSSAVDVKLILTYTAQFTEFFDWGRIGALA